VTPGAPAQPSNSLFLPSSRGSEGKEFECAGVVAEGESEGGGEDDSSGVRRCASSSAW
jgi:hypothetical protein